MKLKNAIRKLNKAGFEVKETEYDYQARKAGNSDVIEFMLNGGNPDDVHCIRVRGQNDHDESMTDYCAGVFVDNITQAIRIANRAGENK